MFYNINDMTLIVQFEEVSTLNLPIESMASSMDSMGTSCSGTIITRDRYSVSQTTDNQDSIFVYEDGTGETTEISRNTATLESSGESSSLVLGGLYSDSTGFKTIQDVITMTPDDSIIKSIDGSTVSGLTIDGSISWDKNECALYLSADKIFRFKYNPASGDDPAMFALESLNQAETAYIPKFEIHNYKS